MLDLISVSSTWLGSHFLVLKYAWSSTSVGCFLKTTSSSTTRFGEWRMLNFWTSSGQSSTKQTRYGICRHSSSFPRFFPCVQLFVASMITSIIASIKFIPTTAAEQLEPFFCQFTSWQVRYAKCDRLFLEAIKPGMAVDFEISQQGKVYSISRIVPAKK